MRQKTLIGGSEDSLQLFPLRYQWAWDMYLENMDNHWTPREIQVASDVALWKGASLSEEERHLFLSIMAQLTTFDVQRGDETAETMQSLFTAPEIKQYLKRLTDEEALHTWSYQFIIENMGLDPEDIYTRYRRVPSMRARVDMANDISAMVEDVMFAQMTRARSGDGPVGWTKREKQILLYAMVFWFCCFEGIWFFLNLAGPIQNLARQSKFINAAEQFQYILRDESQHIRFGVNLINEFIGENPECMTANFIKALIELFTKAIDLEDAYIDYCLPQGVLGYNREMHIETAKFYANLRARSIGMEAIFSNVSHQFPWMSEQMLTKKEKNFFETRVTDYRTGGALQWD